MFLVLLCIIGGVIIYIYIKSLDKKDQSDQDTSKNTLVEEFSILKSGKLFTKSEWYFFYQLSNYLKDSWLKIAPKVRLIDIIEFEKTDNRSLRQKIYNKIVSKHVDFIVCDTYWNIKVIIELDGHHHNNQKASENDDFKTHLFQHLWFNFIRFNASSKYDFTSIDSYISKNIPSEIKDNK